MQFGMQFFPDVGPDEKPADQYFRECLDLAGMADDLGFTHIRIVEHYFHRYGGYSPNPIVFLAAAAQRSRKARLVTGAVLPVFNHPLKIAGELGMLDAISGGRLDAGFARAFLPHEFERFGISPNESVARYREGVEQVRLLLEQENVSHEGRFHTIRNTTSLPRPTQRPRPKFYVAALATQDSFTFAGSQGFSVMAIPMAGGRMRELLGAYRDAWKAAGHPGEGEVMLAFHMFCHPDGAEARRIAYPRLKGYLESLVEGAAQWLEGLDSADYPNYDKVIGKLKETTPEMLCDTGAAWVGTPAEVRAVIAGLEAEYGRFEHASLQVNFNTIEFPDAERSVRLFAGAVMPHFR